MRKKISDKQLARVLWQLTQDVPPEHIEERVVGFVRYLAAESLLHRGAGIAEAFEEVAREAAGTEHLIIETPYLLSESVVADIQKELNLANTEVEIRENRGLLGGIIARTKDRVFDASMTTQLRKLATALVE